MSEGRRSQVVLLDERRLDIVIQTRLYAGELLDIVASHFTLKEKEYFGIAFIDDCGQYSWLHLDKRVLEHNFPKKSSQGTLTFYFRIKYFVESITHLNDSSTIEAFFLQIKSLIAKGELEIDSDIVFQLAALVIQATYGDYTDDEAFKGHLKRLPVLPTCTLKEFPSIAICEQHTLEHYKELCGQTRGAAIVNYLSIVESLPTYGQHYYEIKEKGGNSVCLGLSYRGISQYDKNDRRNPRQVFLWKQLENLYFRDKKFTVEVHEARRVVHTLSSFNLYEDAIEEPVEHFDDLSNAICDPTTQVSVSRRALAPASVTVYVWYAESANIAKCIWSMAIAQHQFFLDRNQKKSVNRVGRSLSQIATELCKSIQSLSSASSHSNISRSNSSVSLPTIIIEGELSEDSKVATVEMMSALQSRKDALQDVLQKKIEELKVLCIKEASLTGELPPETPFQPGEAQPQVRRRIGTSFSINDKIIGKAKNKERETLNQLELDYEIQSKITSAAYKLANDVSARKSVRKVHKNSYQQATLKLKNIQEKLFALKSEKETFINKQRADGSFNDSGINFSVTPSIASEHLFKDGIHINSMLSTPSVHPATSLPHLNDAALSAPSSPAKSRHRHQSLQHVPKITATSDNVYEDVGIPFDSRRTSSTYSHASAEYDAISCGGSSLASLGIPYRNRFEANLDIEGTNHYSVPNRRASQAFNDPDDLFFDPKTQEDISHQSMDVMNSNRYTPLSCSYDERHTFSASNDFHVRHLDDCHDKISLASNGKALSICDELLRYPGEAPKATAQSFNHAHSENALHMTHLKLSQPHISELDLNFDSANGNCAIKHGFSVPALKSALRPIGGSLRVKTPVPDHCSQSINQVVDLVQASVLLQDSKRVLSSTSLDFPSSKSKTKEWVETSLDSPLVSKKRRPKMSESSAKSDLSLPAEWLENGLPPSLAKDCPWKLRSQSEISQKFKHSAGDLRKSPSPLLVNSEQAHSCTADYVNITSSGEPLLQIRERPHSSLGTYHEKNLYHRYQNMNELSSESVSSQPSSSFYENVNNAHSYGTQNNKKKMSESSESNVKHLSLNDIPRLTSHAKAQPQEPPKHQHWNKPKAECHFAESIPETITPSFTNSENDYEPIEYREPSHYSAYEPVRCDVAQMPRPHTFHSESTLVDQDKCDHKKSQSWQNFPTTPPVHESAPLSPTINLSPNVVVSLGHFQPYWEETKPYEISDFYKYSTKHRKQHQFPETVLNESPLPHPNESDSNCSFEGSRYINTSLEVNVSPSLNHHVACGGSTVPTFGADNLNTSENYYENCPISPDVQLQKADEKDKSLSFGEMDLRMSLADTFHDEMVAWYQNQDSVKKATLV